MTAWLAIASPRTAGGAVAERRFSAGLYRPALLQSAERILSLPTISVETLPLGLGLGGSSAASGAITLANGDSALDDLFDLVWEDAALDLYRGTGDAGALGDFTLAARLRVEAATSGADRTLTLLLKDRSSALDRALILPRYAGTGGAEGPAEMKDEVKPVAIGPQTAVRPKEVERAALIYQLHWREMRGVRAIADDATAAGVTDKAVRLANGGDISALIGPAASYDDLKNYNLSPDFYAGKYITWNKGGFIRLAREPAGLVTVDCDGDAAGSDDGGYVERPGEVMRRILADYFDGDGITPDGAMLDALDAAFPHAVKLFTDAEGARVSDWLETAASAAGALWYVDPMGVLKARLFDYAPPGAAIADWRRSQTARAAPWRRVNPLIVGYRTISTVHAPGDLAALKASDLEGAVDFAAQVGGAEKPADNADVTGDNTAAAIAGQGAFATKNVADWIADLINVPVELLDGRIAAAILSGSELSPDVRLGELAGLGTRRIVSGATEVAGINGQSFSFDPPRAEIPMLIHAGGGVGAPTPGSTLAGLRWFPVVEPLNLTQNGFTLRAEFQGIQGLPTSRTDGGASGNPPVIEKSLAEQAPDDVYTYQYDISVQRAIDTGGRIFVSSVTIALDTRTTAGGAWTQRATRTYSNPMTNQVRYFTNETASITVDGLGSAAAFRIRVVSAALNGGAIDAFDSVTYAIAGGSVLHKESMTPGVGEKPIKLYIVGGNEVSVS